MSETLADLEYPLPMEEAEIDDALMDCEFIKDLLQNHKTGRIRADEFYRKVKLALDSLFNNLYEIDTYTAGAMGIDGELYEFLEGLNIHYESPIARTKRMRMCLLPIFQKEKRITWYTLQEKYDDILFHTLCDFGHALEAIEEFKEEGKITETTVIAFNIHIDDPLYEYNEEWMV